MSFGKYFSNSSVEASLRRNNNLSLFSSICGEFHMFGSQFDFTDSMDRQPVDLFRNFLSLCASVYTAQTFGWLPTTALLQAPDKTSTRG